MSRARLEKVAAIVRDAGGTIVGRTRLQKVAYLLEAVGLEEGWSFAYKHYGPYSEELADTARLAHLLDEVREEEKPASWGGTYSVYTAKGQSTLPEASPRRLLAARAASADAIVLELAATAVFLKKEGQADPWMETARRKPEKAAAGRLERAKVLYRHLAEIETPEPLPHIP